MTALAPALQAYFTERLITQRSSSPETIAAYRDAFRLLCASPMSRPASSRSSWTSTIWTRR
jgi:integrase/recombinase XerD